MTTVDAIQAQRDALVLLLQGVTTRSGAVFTNVWREQPMLTPSPGGVEAWVEWMGWQGNRRDGGYFGQTEVFWRWCIKLAIWYLDDPTALAAVVDDFGQAVTNLLLTHIRGGVDPVATGVQILNQVPGHCEVNTVEMDGTYFKLAEWHFALGEQATYMLTN